MRAPTNINGVAASAKLSVFEEPTTGGAPYAPGIAWPWINPCIFNLVQLHDKVRSPPRRQRTVAGAAEQRRSLKKRLLVQATDNLIFI